MFIYFEPVQRSEDGCDMRRFRSFNHSTFKTVLNLLEAVYLRLRKIVVERVTVVKFRVDNRGSNGTGCFRIKVRTEHWLLSHAGRFAALDARLQLWLLALADRLQL